MGVLSLIITNHLGSKDGSMMLSNTETHVW